MFDDALCLAVVLYALNVDLEEGWGLFERDASLQACFVVPRHLFIVEKGVKRVVHAAHVRKECDGHGCECLLGRSRTVLGRRIQRLYGCAEEETLHLVGWTRLVEQCRHVPETLAHVLLGRDLGHELVFGARIRLFPGEWDEGEIGEFFAGCEGPFFRGSHIVEEGVEFVREGQSTLVLFRLGFRARAMNGVANRRDKSKILEERVEIARIAQIVQSPRHVVRGARVCFAAQKAEQVGTVPRLGHSF